MAVSIPWTRQALLQRSEAGAAWRRFDASQAVVISSSDELARLEPAFVRSLGAELDVQALAGRLCPVLLADHCAAVFSLAEHVGGDQADELVRHMLARGYRLGIPQRYVLSAPLLLAIARIQITAKSLASQGVSLLEQSKTALADAFQEIVEWGVRQGASDLHLNVRLRLPESEVKYTISGRYVAPQRFARMPTSILMDMLSVAWMDIHGGNGAVFDPSIEQQGRMIKQVDGKAIMLRWASLAADQGPSVCLRLLGRDAAASYSSLEQLGYLPDQIDVIERAMLSQGGAIIFAGTVGSGKSTTLASLIAGIANDRKIITIEDPVEYLIPGAIQNTVVRDLEATAHHAYATKLRALKRSAMSDVLLGEIRDPETGRAFVDLAGSGVNVYTTTHAPSAALICERLASDFIQVSRDFLATPGVLKLLVYQALLPRLCPHCAVPASRLLKGAAGVDGRLRSPDYWKGWLDRIHRLYDCDIGLLSIRNSDGCSFCRGRQASELRGYTDRTVVAEYIEPALVPGFLDQVRQTDSAGRWHSGMGNPLAAPPYQSLSRSALQCAMVKALCGQIDPRDIEPIFQSFATVERRKSLPGGSAGGAAL